MKMKIMLYLILSSPYSTQKSQVVRTNIIICSVLMQKFPAFM